jgi:tetratricopeptide (TPR) repeat protein
MYPDLYCSFEQEINKDLNKIIEDLLTIKCVDPFTGQFRTVKGQFIEPIHLQIVCKRWWHERNSSNKASIKDLGNVDNALEDFYEDAILSTAKQSTIHEKDIRIWCQQKLITSSGTRKIVHRGYNATGGIDNKVVESLEDKYLIRREWRAGASWYELTHDRLIKPIGDSNKEWFDKQNKSKRTFRIKIFVPIMIISIISISLYFSILQTNQTNIIEEQRQKIEQQQAIIESDKSVIELLTNGIAYFRQHQYDNAIIEFDKVLSTNPNYIKALLYKGLSLNASGNYSEALEQSGKILSIDPSNVYAINVKANIFYVQQKYDEAIAYYDKVLAIDPTILLYLITKHLR